MKIKQDPTTRLWCRSDGAVLMPPSGRFKVFRWTFGHSDTHGYRRIRYRSRDYKVHQIICRAFHGLAPEGKPFVDHINRARGDNRSSNLHWASVKENSDNAGRVDQSIEKYGVRHCDNKKAYKKAYMKAYFTAHREECYAHDKAYREAHREECYARNKSYWAAKAAKMKAQGLHYTKGPDGKWGWFPRVCKSGAV